MSLHNLPFTITPLEEADIAAASAIEQVAYPVPPHRNFNRELNSSLTHYFALNVSLSRLSPTISKIIGIAGIWLIADEIHIATIAVQPRWRGLGLGEWLLLTLIKEGQSHEATTATLEVRPSNHIALSLYQKYGFEEVGRRTNYYSDNGEDALILTTPNLTQPDYQAMLTRRETELFPKLAQIQVDRIVS